MRLKLQYACEKTYGLMGSGSLLYPKNEAALHNASIVFSSIKPIPLSQAIQQTWQAISNSEVYSLISLDGSHLYVRWGFRVSWQREMKLFLSVPVSGSLLSFCIASFTRCRNILV